MIEIKKTGDNMLVLSSYKKEIVFDTEKNTIVLDGFDVNFPGEYEKGGILLEVKTYKEILFYNFKVDKKNITVIPTDKFEISEEILKFLDNVEVLIIKGTKDAAKTFENIEAKVVVPYGELKSTFFTALGQNPEEISVYKIKGELSGDNTEYINLQED
ncbi:MAG: hypothetical protein N4A38_02155 [Candidatus Gracilibacteria bacterium]|nr:hypothetical protein [Candidatus Gracilibacteria bacterium]